MNSLLPRASFLAVTFILIQSLSAVFNISQAEETEYELIEWIQLMPQSDLDALMNPPDYVNSIEDGTAQDTLSTLDKWGETNDTAKRYKQALESLNVIPEFNGRSVKIPGFVVPLETNEDREVTAFFIVPYFGACLHMPPPPPNQIIFGTWKEGLTVESLSIPMWFEGKLAIETKENDLGTSAYSMTLANITEYEG